MKTTKLIRKLAAVTLTLCGGQLAVASVAGAQTVPGPYPPTVSVGGQPAAQAAPANAGAAAPAQAGATGTSPQQIEQKLDALHYDVGPVDGNIDDQAKSAIMAFQKVNGLERTGELTPAVATQIASSQGNPAPMVADGEPNRVEVSLARQVLFLYENGALTKILPVSSGTSKTPTPTGTFHIYRYDPGWHTSSLGRLYNAEYFVGGYAIHGSPSVPAEPASHGCVRIPMSAAEWFPSHVSNGMQVVILEN